MSGTHARLRRYALHFPFACWLAGCPQSPIDTLWSPVFDTVNMFALLRESQLLMADGNNGPLDLNR